MSPRKKTDAAQAAPRKKTAAPRVRAAPAATGQEAQHGHRDGYSMDIPFHGVARRYSTVSFSVCTPPSVVMQA